MVKMTVKASKFVSLVLRHAPEKIGLSLDSEGWAHVDELISKSDGVLNTDLLNRVVEENDKKRFSFSPDGLRIRANQGHSISVDLGLQPTQPPEVLYHGTAARFLPSIRAQGLTPQGRQHVHLSKDIETAKNVGQRHGKVVVLRLDIGGMSKVGHVFLRSANDVWLTDRVPPEFLTEI